VSSVRRTRNILLALFAFGAVLVAGASYTFWPSIVTLWNAHGGGLRSIPSESMAPTLLPGDPITLQHIDPASLTRGTIVVFKLADGDRVSRVAGLPGDTIELRGGVVYIDGQVVPQRPIGPGPALADNAPVKMLSERFPGEAGSHRILDRGESMQDDFSALTVPRGMLFVLGDNRDNTADSRIPTNEHGADMVGFGQLVGRVETMYWANVRGRIGKPIDPANCPRRGGKRMAAITDFHVKAANGTDADLSEFAGKVLLVVNVASKCGFTPQYEGLEALHRKYANRGFEVLGFPCNQFGAQEPGDAEEIANFCSLTYDVTFPVFAKVDVNGSTADPLYAELKKQAPGLLGTEGIKWNFTKFLVGKDGKVVERYAPTTKPEDIAADIEKLL
jgi:glutathione peroxidase